MLLEYAIEGQCFFYIQKVWNNTSKLLFFLSTSSPIIKKDHEIVSGNTFREKLPKDSDYWGNVVVKGAKGIHETAFSYCIVKVA